MKKFLTSIRILTFGLLAMVLFYPSCKVADGTKTATVDSSAFKNNQALVDTEYYMTVEKMPQFQGGDLKSFVLFLKKQIKYPQAAINKKKQGLVVYQFGIDCYGNLKVFDLLQSSGSKLLDNEVKRALQTSPKWTPAVQDKKNVGKLLLLQFHFDLKTKKVSIK